MVRFVIPFVLLSMLIGSGGCFFAPRACYRPCMHQHQRCVTGAKTTNALEWCDHHQRQCRGRCHQ